MSKYDWIFVKNSLYCHDIFVKCQRYDTNVAKDRGKQLTFHCEQENLEKKKAVYVEKLKNKIAMVHREAEEKRAFIEAKKGEDLLKAEELAAKYRATGTAPKKPFSFF